MTQLPDSPRRSCQYAHAVNGYKVESPAPVVTTARVQAFNNHN